eukprot:11065018-Heterocapsa_arctica.AAC.1
MSDRQLLLEPSDSDGVGQQHLGAAPCDHLTNSIHGCQQAPRAHAENMAPATASILGLQFHAREK